MDKNLISKKELLKVTGISYGQLYRWKRKKLIPEEWFIKKSSFTGQETFFPKREILDRIEKIISFKDDVSLDDLANMFSPQLSKVSLTKKQMVERNIVSQMTIDLYENVHNNVNIFSFENILYLTMIEKFLKSGDVSLEEGKNILNTLEKNYKKFQDRHCDVILIRKFGIAICFLLLNPNEIYLEEGAKLVLKLNAAQCVEECKSKIMNQNLV